MPGYAMAGLFESHLRDLMNVTNQIIISLEQAVKTIFKRQNNKPIKDFENIAFEKMLL